MAEIKSPDNRTEFIKWLGVLIDKFTERDGWCESVYSDAINDANGFIELFCQKERIDFVPQLHFSTWVVDFDEALETYRQTTIARLQGLRDVLAPQKNKGGAQKKNQGVWEFIKECDKEKPKPSAPDIAKRLNKKYSGHRTFTGASVRGIRFDYNGGRKRSEQNHKKRRRKTRRKTQ